MESVKMGLAVLLAVAVSMTSPVVADEPAEAKQEVARLWNVDSMMWQAAENISRRYNLNADQREKTHELLTAEVSGFLEEHDNIWPLVRDLARYQMSGKEPEGEVARRIGATALPLMREVRGAILEGNARWREILTEEQKRMHDWDLRDMEKTFAKMEANFGAMTQGAAVKQGLFPPPNKDEPQPVRPRKPRTNFKAADVPEPVSRERPQEEWWDSYVQEFIRRFELDDAQSEAALSVLRECKSRARAYRQSREKDFAQAGERLQQARSAGQPPEVQKAKIRIWTQIEKGLNKPIVELFQELKDRLERIPTDAQKERERRKAGRPAKTKSSETDSKAHKPVSSKPVSRTDPSKTEPSKPAIKAQPKAKATPTPEPQDEADQ